MSEPRLEVQSEVRSEVLNEVVNDAAEGSWTTDATGFGRIKPAVAADRALKEGPVFSIRLQVYFGVFFLFAIVLAIGLLTSATTWRVEREIHRYEVTSKFLFEIDQARRFEKNFFLHGSEKLLLMSSPKNRHAYAMLDCSRHRVWE
jgi:hypothetical protein